MAITLALCAAVAWGWSDFIGGATSRREHHVTVALWSQLLGMVPFLPVALLVSPIGELSQADVVHGSIAGIGGALGLVALFRGLAVGRMAVLDTGAIVSYLLASRQGLLAIVAVLSSLYPAGTVVLARWRLAEHLTRTQLGGLALAGGAVTLIAVG